MQHFGLSHKHIIVCYQITKLFICYHF